MADKTIIPLVLVICLFGGAIFMFFFGDEPQTLKSTQAEQWLGDVPEMPSVELVLRSKVDGSDENQSLSVEAVDVSGTRLTEPLLRFESEDGTNARTISDVTAGKLAFSKSDLQGVDTVVLSHRGYYPRTLDIEELADLRNVRIALSRGEELQVLATDSTGQPIDNVICVAANNSINSREARLVLSQEKIAAFMSPDIRLMQWQRTDVRGKAVISGLRKGRFSFRAFHPDYIVAHLDIGDRSLPSFVHAHMVQPGVLLADFDNDVEVISWILDIPKSMRASGFGRVGVQQLKRELRAKFPKAIFSAGIPKTGDSYPPGLLKVCLDKYGWQEIMIPYRRYKNNIEPIKLNVNTFKTVQMGSVKIALTFPSIANPFSDKKCDGMMELTTMGHNGRPDRRKRIPIKTNRALPLPYGRYIIEPTREWVKSSAKWPVYFSINREELVDVSIAFDEDYFPVTFIVKDGKGRDLNAGGIGIRVREKWETFNYSDNLSGVTVPCAEGWREYKVRGLGYPLVEGKVKVTPGTKMVVTIRCAVAK